MPNWLTRADLPAAEDSNGISSGGRSEQAYKHRVRGVGTRRFIWLTKACTTLSKHSVQATTGVIRPDAPRAPERG